MKTISDQVCIHTPGNANVAMAAENLLIYYVARGGCTGPSLWSLNFWTKKGLVSLVASVTPLEATAAVLSPPPSPKVSIISASQPPGDGGAETPPGHQDLRAWLRSFLQR